jgi:flagellar hook-length control protein FliK
MTEPNLATATAAAVTARQLVRQPAGNEARAEGGAGEGDPAANFDRVMADVSARHEARPGQDTDRGSGADDDDRPLAADPAPEADDAARVETVIAAEAAFAALPAVTAPAAPPALQATDAAAPKAVGEHGPRMQAPTVNASAPPTQPIDTAPQAQASKAPPRGAAPTRPFSEPSAHDAGAREPGAAAAPLPQWAALEKVEDAAARHFARGPIDAAAARADTSAVAANPAIAPAAIHAIAHARVATPVLNAGFAEEFANRVVFLAGQRVQSAEVALTPADLGPVSVSIEVRGHEASVVFGAAHATTRAALEDALPRLREMFAGSGLQLTNAQVGEHGRRDFARPQRGAVDAARPLDSAVRAPDLLHPMRQVRSDRLIDIVV